MSWDSERPCTVFSGLDLEHDVQVAQFLHWLWTGDVYVQYEEHRRVTFEESMAEHERRLQEQPWRAIEEVWGDQAPRRRMAQLLWRSIKNATEEDYFRQFSAHFSEILDDCRGSGKLLLPVQSRLKAVFDAYYVIDHSNDVTGQAAFGESFYLPRSEADFVREQLRRTQLTILTKASDYREAVETHLRVLVNEVIGLVVPPVPAHDRGYRGFQSEGSDGEVQSEVVVVHGADESPLPDPSSPGGGHYFGWGYFGAGPKHLALSILTDAADGDIKAVEPLAVAFRDEIVGHWPTDGFSVDRATVLRWLADHGVDAELLAGRKEELHERWDRLAPRVQHYERALQEPLVAQRFDLVAHDFEASLYLDLYRFFEEGGRVLKCTRCQLPILWDGSPRSNRQLARWKKNQSIYHEKCFAAVQAERKRTAWHRWAAKPEIQARRRSAKKKSAD